MDVRSALLRAARNVFAETGTRGATTRRIAREAGVNEVTLFRHFRGKDDLIHEAMSSFAREVSMRTLPADPVDPSAELRGWCGAHHRELYNVRSLIRHSMAEFDEHPKNCAHGLQASIRISNELTEYLRRLREKGLAKGRWDERAAAAMLMGAIFTDAMGRDTMPERYPYAMRKAVDCYVDLLLKGIGAEAAGSRPTARGPKASRRKPGAQVSRHGVQSPKLKTRKARRPHSS